MRVELCSACGAPIAAGEARCSACGASSPRALVARRKRRIAPPRAFRLDERVEGEVYVARVRGDPLVALSALVLCVLWDALVLVLYVVALEIDTWALAVIGLVPLGIGALVTHRMLVVLMNRGELRIGDRVRFRSGPVPFGGRLDVALEQVKSFSAVVRRSFSSFARYRVVVRLASGSEHAIDVGAPDARSAAYVAASFEDALRRAKERVSP